MVRNGQKSIWKKNPLCYEKDQARVLWWKFQHSRMQNGKVNIFYVAQWSKLVNSQLVKIWAVCFDKDQARALWWKFQLSSMKIANLVFLMLHSGQKRSIWKNFDHCVMKKIRQGLCGENFSSLECKMAKLAFLCCTVIKIGQKSI